VFSTNQNQVCKQCGGPVIWEQQDGRWRCYNPDYTEHWDTCSRNRWNRVAREGKRFERKQATGYVHQKKEKYERISSGIKHGDRYQPRPCPHDVPPWEDCDQCNAPVAQSG
jgi:ribosomal protein S27AE